VRPCLKTTKIKTKESKEEKQGRKRRKEGRKEGRRKEMKDPCSQRFSKEQFFFEVLGFELRAFTFTTPTAYFL
jgi:hypothetical protein